MTFEAPRAELSETQYRKERALSDANTYVLRAIGIATAMGVREEFYSDLKGIVELYEFDNDKELTTRVKE